MPYVCQYKIYLQKPNGLKKDDNMDTYPFIETKDNLSAQDFFLNYVGKKPIVIKNLTSDWRALSFWGKDYFLSLVGKDEIQVNILNNKEIKKKIYLTDYINSVMGNKSDDLNKNKDLYFYDQPLIAIIPSLQEDLKPFPLAYLESWYRPNWWKNIFLFYTTPGTIIPLHFDHLGTHNLYFHLKGEKKFIITLPDDLKYCYMTGHRSSVNPERPDYKAFPAFKKARTFEILLSPGDVLYLPPFTLHQVLSINSCISFKIDWHTKKSALLWIKKLHKGVSLKSVYYNLLYMIGIFLRVPSKFLYSAYKSSLSRVRILTIMQ